MKLKVGTDFSGIGAPEQALKNLGIDFESVFACEIDKYARQSYSAIHDEPKRFYNDITKRDHREVEQLDLYVAGFPCQSFSIAGQRKGFDEARGTLFFDVAEFIRINQPKCFILENVKGLLSHDKGRTYQTITDILTNGGGTLNGQISIDLFDDGLGYHCIAQVLNTRDYGVPQNRERIFIVGFKDFREFSFPIKEQLQLRLRDMLQDNPDSKYYLSDKAIKKIEKHDNPIFKNTTQQVSGCIHSGYYKMGGRDQQYIKVKSATQKGYEIALDGDSINFSVPNSETRRGRVGKGVAQTLDTQCNQAIVQPKIRRLTPLECWRLQDFPDDAFLKAADVCSDTQLYKQAGNSITVAVIQKIIQKIY
jgi:DNA (cytosine-5)-methyltransferase 1